VRAADGPLARAELGAEPAGLPSANQADSCEPQAQVVSHLHTQFSQRQSGPQQQPAEPDGVVRGVATADEREAAQHEQVAVLVIGSIPFDCGRVSPF
jgi:hypothetical protein